MRSSRRGNNIQKIYIDSLNTSYVQFLQLQVFHYDQASCDIFSSLKPPQVLITQYSLSLCNPSIISTSLSRLHPHQHLLLGTHNYLLCPLESKKPQSHDCPSQFSQQHLCQTLTTSPIVFPKLRSSTHLSILPQLSSHQVNKITSKFLNMFCFNQKT